MKNIVLFLTVLIVLPAAALAAGDAKAGQAVYDRECKDCHAMNGAPVASVKKAMERQKVQMRDLKAAEVQRQSEDEWKKMITAGIGKMKPVPTVTAAEMDNLLAFMRSLKKK